ncbi:MAG: TonB-dependent receptor, partial [Muribaculaceae bacterium]|nr:TonB-dependent receptor [Muribaculaceae bacterium]
MYIGGSWSEVRKDLQTGAVQNVVYGMAERHTTDWSLRLRYRKRNLLTEGLTLNLNASYTHDNSCTIDTAYRKYSWDGSWIPTNRNEISGNARMMRHYERPLTIARANLDYELADWHSLNLNFMLNASGNHRYDSFDVSFQPSSDYFTKTIIGLTYTQTLVNSRLTNTLFVKDYINYVKIGQTDEYWITGSKAAPASSTKQNVGYGLGSRYSFFDELALKASYENTVRLPLARELLGNGTTVYPNLRLRPEKSHNFNLALEHNGQIRNSIFAGSYSMNAMGYFNLYDSRITTTDYPGDSANEPGAIYCNEDGVKVAGLDISARYRLQMGLGMMLNYNYLHTMGRTVDSQFSNPRPHSMTWRVDYERRLCSAYKFYAGISGRYLAKPESEYDTDNAYSVWKFTLQQEVWHGININFIIDNLLNYKPKVYYWNSLPTIGRTWSIGVSLDIDTMFR